MNKIGPGQNFIDPRQNSVGQTFNLSEYGLAPEGQQQPIDTILSQAVPLFPIDSLKDAKQAWATLAYTTVKQCFKKEYGKITIDKSRVEEIINFWQENPNPPAGFENVPSWTLVRTQTLSVLKVVKADMDNVTAEDIVGMTQYGKGDSLVEILMRASTKIPYSDFTVNGYQMLESMSASWPGPIGPHEAILASLLTPHRQWALPSCAFDALINEETCNNPAALARIFLRLLESEPMTPVAIGVENNLLLPNLKIIPPRPDGDQGGYTIISPSGTAVNISDICGMSSDEYRNLLAPIWGPLNLTFDNHEYDIDHIDAEDDKLFVGEWIIDSILPELQNAFAHEGIEVHPYTATEPENGTLWLKYPIHNLTDALFANMMQYLYMDDKMFAKKRELHQAYYDAAANPAQNLYTATNEPRDYTISTEGLRGLRDRVLRLRAAGQNRHLAAIWTWEGGRPSAHRENLYLDALAEVPIDGPDPDSYYIIGDRNYTNEEGQSTFLAVRKVRGKEDRWDFIEVTEPNVAEPLHYKKINIEP